MFEAKLNEALVLKKIIEAIKDLVTDVNIDATPSGISLQAMDSSHVALGSMGFEEYRADRAMTLGVSVTNLAKVLKLASNEDKITLRAEEEGQHLHIVFENRRQEKRTEFQLNLIRLDSEHLGIPETQYSSEVTMNAQDFQKLCKELHQLSETVQIEASVTSIKFTVEGEVGNGSVQIMTSGDGPEPEEGRRHIRKSESVVRAAIPEHVQQGVDALQQRQAHARRWWSSTRSTIWGASSIIWPQRSMKMNDNY